MPSEWLHRREDGTSEWLPERPDDGAPATKGGDHWRTGIKSNSMGCHSMQAKEMNRLVRRENIPGIRYSEETGKCHITSRQGRARELRRRGFCDLDGGYGDG